MISRPVFHSSIFSYGIKDFSFGIESAMLALEQNNKNTREEKV